MSLLSKLNTPAPLQAAFCDALSYHTSMLLTCRASHQGALSLPQVLVLFLCMTIFGCFVYELAAVKPVWLDVAKGFIPTPEILTNTEMLYTAIGIVGEHPPHPSGPCLCADKAADAEHISLCFSWYTSSDLNSAVGLISGMSETCPPDSSLQSCKF